MHLSTLLLPLLVAGSLVSAKHGPNPRRHHAKLIARNDTDVVKRGQTFSGTATWYDTGRGACGQYSNPGDFMVALNSAQYGGGYPGPQCSKWITVSHNGQTRQAQVLDECPTCAYGFLDFSPGLFDSFGLGDRYQVGVMDITWWFNDDAPSQPAPSSAAPPPPPPPSSTWQAPSSTWTPPPPSSTSQWVAPFSTSTWTPPPASSSTWSSVAPSSSSSVLSSAATSSTAVTLSSISWMLSASSTWSAASASASASAIPKQKDVASTSGGQQAVLGQDNIAGLNVLTAQFGGLVVAGARTA